MCFCQWPCFRLRFGFPMRRAALSSSAILWVTLRNWGAVTVINSMPSIASASRLRESCARRCSEAWASRPAYSMRKRASRQSKSPTTRLSRTGKSDGRIERRRLNAQAPSLHRGKGRYGQLGLHRRARLCTHLPRRNASHLHATCLLHLSAESSEPGWRGKRPSHQCRPIGTVQRIAAAQLIPQGKQLAKR